MNKPYYVMIPDIGKALALPEYADIPGTVLKSLYLYVEYGRKPGDFLTAVLSNQLFQAFQKADSASKAGLDSLIHFIWKHVPVKCYGDARAVERWISECQEARYKVAS